MKKQLLTIILVLFAFLSRGQNLVPNPGFELYSGCPTYYTQIDCVQVWTNTAVWPGPGGSPDYFNKCATPSSNVDVPSNIFGFQDAHNGDAYIGLAVWDMNTLFREYIQAPFANTLEEGCYNFEMYISLADKYRYATSPLGVYFSPVPISGIPNFLPLPYTPQITLSGFIADTSSWMLLTGSFTAQGNENYMIIGNFSDDASTTSTFVNTLGVYDQSYVFIDDVSLEKCGTTNLNAISGNNGISIYPNPVTGGQLEIKNLKQVDSGGMIEIFDINGRLVFSETRPKWNDGIIILPHLSDGMYKCMIRDEKKIITQSIAIMSR